MDLPTNDVELVPEKEKIEDGKEGCPTFHCDLYDTEVVYKVAQVFLSGLAAACVDNTTGGIFKSPASVAVEMRKEMIEYLTMRSENYVAESVILEGDPNTEVSDNPYDIISDFVDDFASSKRNFFSRVSGWLLSEKREDRVDDFVQEMETNGFWLTDRRETIAQTLVKNVDFKNTCHCDEKFNTAAELAEHVANCDFRTMNCTNEGCIFVLCARHMEKHDSDCPFKIIPCEQKCSESLMRREMDRHCITVCPMKLVNCPFYGVGCQSTVPRCMIQQHCSDELQLHLTCALKNIHKGAPEGDIKKRANEILEGCSDQLQGTRDARSLTLRVRDLDAKLGPLKFICAEKSPEESTGTKNDNTRNSTEHSVDDADESSDKAVNFYEPSIVNADMSLELARDNAYKAAAEDAIHHTEKFAEPPNDNAGKSAEPETENTDKSIEPTSVKSSDKAVNFSEPSIVNANMSIELARDNAYKAATEDAIHHTERFAEPANENAGKFAEPETENTDKSIEPTSLNVEKSTEFVSDDADKSTEPASYNGDKSIDPARGITVNSNEPASDDADKSTDPAIDNVDESTKSSEDRNSREEAKLPAST